MRTGTKILFAWMALLASTPVLPADINSSTWSENAGSNTAARPNAWPENMASSAVHDTASEMMASLKRWSNHSSAKATATSGGTANAQILTYAVAANSLVTGGVYKFIAGFSNTGAATININSLGAKTIRIGTTPLAGGEIQVGQIVELTYDGTYFQLNSTYPQILTPQQFGATGDGVSNDSVAFQVAVNNASTRRIPLHIPAGSSFAIDDITIPSPLTITGDGPNVSKLLRLPSSSAVNGMMHCFSTPELGCSYTWISGITIDGNKDNATSTSTSNLNIGHYSDVHLRDVISINSKGSNLNLDKSADEAAGTTSDLINFTSTGATSDGIVVTTKAWKLLAENVISNRNDSYGMNIYYTPGATPVADQFQYITVRGGQFSSNGGSGFVARGWIKNYAGGDPARPIYGPGPAPVSHILVTGVTARDNYRYGIVVQAKYAIVSDSVAINNNLANDYGGGFLGPCFQCQWNNLYASNNDIGLDVGTGVGAHIRGGTFENNHVGVNIGATSDSDIRGATVTNNTTHQIHADSAEGDGDGFGIEGFTDSLVIADNRVGCENTGIYGIRVYHGGLNINVLDNHVQGCDLNKAIYVEAASAKVSGNTVADPDNPMKGLVDLTTTATTNLVIPVWADTVGLTGTNNFSKIKTYEQNNDGNGAYAVQMTSFGSGYTNGTATATVSGCTVAPTGKVMVNRGGEVTGYRISSTGSGCVNPTISFGGGGSGAAGTVFSVPLSTGFQKYLTLMVEAGASLNIGGSGNIELGSAVSGFGPSSSMRFLFSGQDGLISAYETGRVAH